MKKNKSQSQAFINSIIKGKTEEFYNGLYVSLLITKGSKINDLKKYTCFITSGNVEMYKSKMIEVFEKTISEIIDIGIMKEEIEINAMNNQINLFEMEVESYTQDELLELPTDYLQLLIDSMAIAKRHFNKYLRKYNKFNSDFSLSTMSNITTCVNQLNENIKLVSQIISMATSFDNNNINYVWN